MRSSTQAMRREDVHLNSGTRLVILRDGYDHYVRLLINKEGTPTFITPPLPLDPFDQKALTENNVYRCYAGTLLILVDGENRVIIKLGDYTEWGQRQRLTEALNAIAR